MPVLLQTTLLLICSNVFVPFAVLSMKQPLKLNELWAAMCICGAVYFVFREA
ncbi:MAG: DMT family protein [Planctomycetota bacterium]